MNDNNDRDNSAIKTTIKQKYLGNKGIVVFLALLSAFVPLQPTYISLPYPP